MEYVTFVQDEDEVCAVFTRQEHPDGMLTCYSHFGQHSKCSREWARSMKPAKDYSELKAELERIGYKLRVVSRSWL